MSHLHIPDGVLPLWLVLVGWVATTVLLTVSNRRLRTLEMRRRIPLVGSLGALMLVAMSSEIVPIAYHVNLSIVAGAILGPWLSPFTAVVVVTMLALIGHGGVTVIGLNTLVISSEMILGWTLVQLLTRLLSPRRRRLAAALATVLTLFLTTSLVIGIVAVGGAPAATRESGAFDPDQLRFENPFERGWFGNALFESPEGEPEEESPLPLGRFALLLYTLGSLGWLIEAAVTAAILGFIGRVRPSLVEAGLPLERRPPGDEGVHR